MWFFYKVLVSVQGIESYSLDTAASLWDVFDNESELVVSDVIVIRDDQFDRLSS